MSHSFEVVEDKLFEAEFFLEQMRSSSPPSFEANCFFSAFVSAARSTTFAMQASLKGVTDFDSWYKIAQGQLREDPLAPFFVEIRNQVIHEGINPLNRVTSVHLREHLLRQLNQSIHSHVLVLPDPHRAASTVLVDAVEVSTCYFTSLVSVIFECYERYKYIVDPRWYYTKENFDSRHKTFEDALTELGFPPEWASCVPSEVDGWRLVRSQQPECRLNVLFKKHLGRHINDPDDSTT